VAEQGSVVKVVPDEKLSEYQMLEAMLLPSANNMADSLAIWAFGSLPAYSAAANSYLNQVGLKTTHVGPDASGFIPTTVSTAHDLVIIGELVMSNPILAQVVSQLSVTNFPVVNTIKNVNYLIGTDNIVGIKTGNTDQAGGVYVGAAKTSVGGQPVTVITANVGAPTLGIAVSGSLPLLQSAESNFQALTLVKKDTLVGTYNLPWGGSTPIVASSDLVAFAWGGSSVSIDPPRLDAITYPAVANQTIGAIGSKSSGLTRPQFINVVLKQSINKPTLLWRLLHPKLVNY
jgi:D-alanyl-D-alanine carboxypeptidase (penicillin-binding protein 5/6)